MDKSLWIALDRTIGTSRFDYEYEFDYEFDFFAFEFVKIKSNHAISVTCKPNEVEHSVLYMHMTEWRNLIGCQSTEMAKSLSRDM